MREAAGITQRELASAINKSQSWVQKSEIGSRRVDVAEFVLFCQGCSVDPRKAIGELIRR
jgi:transcriptional regulator with XRE-family HTH domain